MQGNGRGDGAAPVRRGAETSGDEAGDPDDDPVGYSDSDSDSDPDSDGSAPTPSVHERPEQHTTGHSLRRTLFTRDRAKDTEKQARGRK